MRKQRIFVLISILGLILTGCAASLPTGDRVEFDSYLSALDRQRDKELSWREEEKELFPAYAPDFSEQAGAFDKDEMDRLLEQRGTSDITGAEAFEDVETFFRLLQTTYGGYSYFGGDEVFRPIREELLDSLKETDKISAADLKELLYGALSDVIVDGHFMIGDYYFTKESEQFMYYVPELYFDELSGIDPEYVKPTIGPAGQLTYCFATLSNDGSGLPASAEISGKQYSLDWKKAEVYSPGKDGVKTADNMPAYRKTSVSGLPVLESRILYAKEGEEEIQQQLEQMAGAGGEYRDLAVLIVDLRNNGGGDSYYGKSWIEGFTGGQPQSKVAYFEKCSELYLKTLAVNPAYANVDTAWKDTYFRKKGKWIWGSQDGALLNNDTVVFLLSDKGTGSSGEDFVRDLSTVNHVIRVGTNTAGVLQFGNVCEFFLPHSGLFLRMGSKMSFYGGLEMSEGIGVLPDLWVNGPDALDAVVRMCNYYGLNEPGN